MGLSVQHLLKALLLLFLVTGSKAEPINLTVETYPPGASMRDQFGNQLGLTGSEIVVDWSREKGPLQLELSLEGHKSVSRSLIFQEIKKGRYPDVGVVTLPPESLMVRVTDSFRFGYGWLILLCAIGGSIAVRMVTSRKPTDVTEELKKTELVGGYELLHQVGQGATAVVYRVRSADDDSGLEMALKLMREGEVLDGQAKERFRSEIRSSLGLEHPNLAKIYDWGETDDGRLYLVSELLSGVSLRDRLRKKPTPEFGLIEEVVEAIAAALSYLHGRNLIHRDVKPENIFLTRERAVKLVDLGLAKGRDAAPLTQAGMAMGTPHYTAPEQAQGSPTQASDQYSLAVLCFEMLAGERPYQGSDGLEIFQKHISSPVPSLQDFRPDISPMLDDILQKAMAKRPDERFETVMAFSEALIAALAEDGGDDTAACEL